MCMPATNCAPCQATTAADETATSVVPGGATFAADPDAPPPPAPEGDYAPFEGIIAFEGQTTGDGYLIEPGALTWPRLPFEFRYVVEDVGGHDNAVVVGRVTSVERRDDGAIWATGDIDLGSETGREAARMIEQELQNGVSVDLDDVVYEVRVRAELLDEPEEVEPVVDADGRVTVHKGSMTDELYVTVGARIRSATVCAIPKFADARVHLTSEGQVAREGAPAAVVAAGAAARIDDARPPTAWFADPALDGPTPITITDDGRMYGHLALWDTCHVSYTAGGQCIRPPRSATSYAHFRLGATRTREGHDVATGTVTLGTGHATAELTADSARRHYDHTGTAVADVTAGEDQWGIWVAGALRPGLGEDRVRELRAAPLSGDWRRAGTGLELVAALAVNVPGFPVPRVAGMVAGGAPVSLVAAGMLNPPTPREPPGMLGLTAAAARTLMRLAEREHAADAARVESMAARLRAATAAGMADRVRSATRGGHR